MIVGYKPAAYFVTADGNGLKIEGEQRQCVHCQCVWTYRPGSGVTRGFCLRCNGFVCGRPECERQQRAMLAEFSRLSGATDRHCMPYTDYRDRQLEALAKDSRYTVTPGGIVIVNG